jgi:hypothetical protein
VPGAEQPEQRMSHASGDCRCVCGSLVARLVSGGVELKCRRCKRTLVVPLSGAAAASPESHPSPPVRAAG